MDIESSINEQELDLEYAELKVKEHQRRLEVMKTKLNNPSAIVEHRKLNERVWEVTEVPIWEWTVYDYRIKKEPIYKAFSYENVPIGMPVKNKKTGMKRLIIGASRNFIYVSFEDFLTYNDLLKDYLTLNDTPCGILEEL